MCTVPDGMPSTASLPPPAVGSERPTLAAWATLLTAVNTIPLGTGALDELSAPLPSGAQPTLPLGSGVPGFTSAPLPSGAPNLLAHAAPGPETRVDSVADSGPQAGCRATGSGTAQASPWPLGLVPAALLRRGSQLRSCRWTSTSCRAMYLSARCSRATCSSGECARCPPDRRTQGQCARRRRDDNRASARYGAAPKCGIRPGSTRGAGRLGATLHTAAYALGDLALPAYIAPPHCTSYARKWCLTASC
ncbi:hypothetical protein VTO73DRAFT_9997 [Trametes versicolor]